MKSIVLAFSLLISLCTFAQVDSLVQMQVVVSTTQSGNLPMVITMKKGEGQARPFLPSEKIILQGLPGDTFIVSALGYSTKLLAVGETSSVETIKLRSTKEVAQSFPKGERYNVDDPEVTADQLGYNPKTDMITGVDGFSSPITAMYTLLSRTEKSKRKVATLQNEDKRRKVLRKLLDEYNKQGVIDLPEDQYDDFIEQSKITDAMLKTNNNYDIIIYIRDAVNRYKYANP